MQEESMLLWCLYQSLLQKPRLGKACAYCNLRFLFVAGRCGALWSDAAVAHLLSNTRCIQRSSLVVTRGYLSHSYLPVTLDTSSPRELLLACYVLLFRPSSVNLGDDCVGKSQQLLKHTWYLQSCHVHSDARLELQLMSALSFCHVIGWFRCLHEWEHDKVCKWRPIIKTSSTHWDHNIKDGWKQATSCMTELCWKFWFEWLSLWVLTDTACGSQTEAIPAVTNRTLLFCTFGIENEKISFGTEW